MPQDSALVVPDRRADPTDSQRRLGTKGAPSAWRGSTPGGPLDPDPGRGLCHLSRHEGPTRRSPPQETGDPFCCRGTSPTHHRLRSGPKGSSRDDRSPPGARPPEYDFFMVPPWPPLPGKCGGEAAGRGLPGRGLLRGREGRARAGTGAARPAPPRPAPRRCASPGPARRCTWRSPRAGPSRRRPAGARPRVLSCARPGPARRGPAAPALQPGRGVSEGGVAVVAPRPGGSAPAATPLGASGSLRGVAATSQFGVRSGRGRAGGPREAERRWGRLRAGRGAGRWPLGRSVGGRSREAGLADQGGVGGVPHLCR